MDRRDRCALRAAPGCLVLALGASAARRLSAGGPDLSRALLPCRVPSDVGADDLHAGRRTSTPGTGAVDPCAHRLRLPRRRPVHRRVRVQERARRRRRRGGLLPGRPFPRPRRVPAVALRHQHDGLHDSRFRGPRLRQRRRHLRAHGVVVGVHHPADAVLRGHPHVGAGQASRVHDAGADVPRSLGVRAYRHGDLRRAGGHAGALHHHRRHGRRHGHSRHHRRLRPVLARWSGRRPRGHGLRVLRRDARHGVGQRVPGGDVSLVWRGRARRDRPRHGRVLRSHRVAACAVPPRRRC